MPESIDDLFSSESIEEMLIAPVKKDKVMPAKKIAPIKNLKSIKPKQVAETKPQLLPAVSVTLPPLPAAMAAKKPVGGIPASLRNPAIIQSCLTKDEFVYFLDRWNTYYEEYGSDLNSANDYDQMVELIMCLIDVLRIQKKKMLQERLVTDPNVDQIMHRVHTRIQSLLTSLKTRRKDRLDDGATKENNVIGLLMSKAKSDFSQEVAKRTALEQELENQHLKEKIARGNRHFDE